MLFLASLLGGVGVLVLHLTVGLGGPQTNELFDDGVYNALMFGAAFAVIARAITVKAQRAAWLAMGAGLLCWSLGELYFTLFVEGPGEAGGSISPADVLYLAMYPCMYVALTLLVGAHLRELRISMWLDGLIAGSRRRHARGRGRAAADRGQRHGRRRLGRGRAGLPDRRHAAVDLHDRRARHDRLAPGARVAADRREHAAQRDRRLDLRLPDRDRHLPANTWVEGLWPAAAVLLAIAAWTPWPRTVRRRIEDWRLVTGAGAVAAGRAGRVRVRQPAPPADAAGADPRDRDGARGVRAADADGAREPDDADRLAQPGADRSADGAGQPPPADGRPASWRAAGPGPSEPWRLAMYDLNGFKRYNDTYGHPAGR